MMKVEFINPFVNSAFMVLERFGKIKANKGNLRLVPSPIEGKDVNTVVGVTGDVLGQVIYSIDSDTALKIASFMLMGMPVTELDELCKSAVSEMGNIITGNAATELSENGFICNVTPPSLFIGKDVRVSVKDSQVLVVPIISEIGELTINIALREADK